MLTRISPPDQGELVRIAPSGTPVRLTPAPSTTTAVIRALTLTDKLTITGSTPHYTANELGTGRGLTYEWELVVADILDRLAVIEGGGLPNVYIQTQATPAATWTITHNLGTTPVTVLTDPTGQVVWAEIDYPDVNTAVVTFASPFAGIAVLRA